ncbi:MAG: DUF2142 domain-containing protein [Clostridia bacterium]|nr:DUF2142 domain-containing protein [Clostridia bacterium]
MRTARILAAALALLLAAGYAFFPAVEDQVYAGNSGRKKQEIPTEGELSWSWTPESGSPAELSLTLSGKKKAAGMTVIAAVKDARGSTLAETAQPIDELGDGDSVLLNGSFSRGTAYTLTLRAEGEGSIKVKGEEDEEGVFYPQIGERGVSSRRNPVLLFFAAGLVLLALTPLKEPATRLPRIRPARRERLLPWAAFLMLTALGVLVCLTKPVFDNGNGWMTWDEDEVHQYMVGGMLPWGAVSLADWLSYFVTWYPGYLPLALGGTLAGLFTRNSDVIYRACILASSVCYAGMVALAVAHAPKYKITFLTAGTIPAHIFQMTSRTYDTVVTGSILLGLALVLESCSREEKVTPLRGMTMAALMAFGTASKPAYSLVLLSLLMIPADRFGGKRQAWMYRGFSLLMLAWCMTALVIPGAYDAVRGGDSRFPGADSAAQIAWILASPLERGLIPVRYLWESQHMLMNMGIAHWAYLGNNEEWMALYLALMLAVAPLCVWDEKREAGRLLTPGRRILLGVIVFAAELSLIYTQFIVSSPAGEGWIQGMQARYFMPLWIGLLLAVMMPERLRERISPQAGGIMTWTAFSACAICNFSYAVFWLTNTGYM